MKRWSLVLSMLLLLACGGQGEAEEIEPELKAYLENAKATAAVLAGHYEEAETNWLCALSLGNVTPEPLIRLYLLKKQPESASNILQKHGDKLDSQEKKLLSRLLLESGPGISTEAPEKVTHHLYRGLLLAREKKQRESEIAFAQFLTEADWGWDLAAPFKLGANQTLCNACVKSEAQHFYQAFAVCSICLGKLRDPVWNRQCLAAPTEEQLEIFARLYRLDLNEFVEDLKTMNTTNVGAQSALIPVQRADDLLSELGPTIRKVYEPVLSEGKSPSVSTTVSQLYSAVNDECRSAGHDHPPIYPERLEEFDSLDRIDWEWVLNLANWNNKLQPPYGTKPISGRDLINAIDFVRGESLFRISSLALLASSKMADDQIPHFEGLLKDHPNDIFLHAILAQDRVIDWSAEAAQRQLRNRLWLIRECPELAKQHHWTGIDSEMDFELVKAWVEKLTANPSEPKILGAAADVFQFKDRSLSIKLYQKCNKLEPDNPEWLKSISRLLSYDDQSAYEHMEEAIKNSSEDEQGSLLTEHILNAFDAGELERAKEIADELLGLVENGGWNSGNAHFKAHTVLGLLALENDDLKLAKHHLLQSAKTKGSPQLNTFGPNMRLAQALLQRGEREVVLRFLESCQEFWESSYPAEWTRSIKAGTIPDFGPNLLY